MCRPDQSEARNQEHRVLAGPPGSKSCSYTLTASRDGNDPDAEVENPENSSCKRAEGMVRTTCSSSLPIALSYREKSIIFGSSARQTGDRERYFLYTLCKLSGGLWWASDPFIL